MAWRPRPGPPDDRTGSEPWRCPHHPLHCTSPSPWTAPAGTPPPGASPRPGPAELFTAGYWADLVAEAERGLLDFVTIEDALGLQSSRHDEPDDRTDQVRGRLDAVLIAARVAPLTRHIGLVPTAIVTHTEPFHVSKAIATLDYVSTGRAGLRVQVSARPHEAAHFGRRAFPRLRARRTATEPAVQQLIAELFDEAADYVEVVRRLWDSWEDDAEIRDAATGRFVDRDKLHYIDFAGDYFSVKGPSITPRPPQGQPIVTALGPRDASRTGWSPRSADVGFVTPHDADHARRDRRRDPRRAGARPGGPTRPCTSSATWWCSSTTTPRRAAARKDRLDELAGRAVHQRRHRSSPAPPPQLADLLQDWQAAGLTGFRLRPARLAARPRGDHPGPGARAAAPRRVPHRLRGRHPARPARPRPPRQPLRHRLTH